MQRGTDRSCAVGDYKENRKGYIVHWVLWVILLLIVLLYTQAAIWLCWPYKTVTVVSPHTVSEPVYAGGVLTYDYHTIKHLSRPATVYRILIDEKGNHAFGFLPVYSNVKKGYNKGDINLYVPRYLPEGRYKLRIIYRYTVNPLRTMDVVFDSEWFTLRKR
jgi:hypothetical protein